MIVFEAVEAYGDAFQSVVDELVKLLRCEQHAVSHHAPHEAAFAYLGAAFGQVSSHHGLAASGDDHHLGRIFMCLYLI